jgi:hypothetical protein
MMLTPQERVLNLLSDLRIQPVDFEAVYAGKNNLTPLESVELFPAWKNNGSVLRSKPCCAAKSRTSRRKDD